MKNLRVDGFERQVVTEMTRLALEELEQHDTNAELLSTALKDNVREQLAPELAVAKVPTVLIPMVFQVTWEKAKSALKTNGYQLFPTVGPSGYSRNNEWIITWIPDDLATLDTVRLERLAILFAAREEHKRMSSERHAASARADHETVQQIRKLLRRVAAEETQAEAASG